MRQLETISETVRQFYLTLALQGIIFIVLAVLIVMYPALLYAMVSILFMLIGISLLALAWKTYTFWQKLPSFLKK